MKIDLTKLEPENDLGLDFARADYTTDTCHVEAFHSNLEHHLRDFISRADVVVGCMAWLTNRAVLRQLALLKGGCQIVVQKEDFLRPDVDASGSRGELRDAYDRLRCRLSRYELPGFSSSLSVCSDASTAAVRCMGVRGRGTVPRMHHKFLVACRIGDAKEIDGYRTGFSSIDPYAAWTGSFNATTNGTLSLENAVIINSHIIASAYADEWSRVFALSEPLDWASEYVEPEWRLGS
jgi:hypothetical protein